MPQRVMGLVIWPYKKFPQARSTSPRPVTDELCSNSLAALTASALKSDRSRASRPGPPSLALWALPESFHHVSSSSKSSSVGTSSSFSSVLLALLGQLPSSSRPSIPSLQITKVISSTPLLETGFAVRWVHSIGSIALATDRTGYPTILALSTAPMTANVVRAVIPPALGFLPLA